jgi:hypothetical protein
MKRKGPLRFLEKKNFVMTPAGITAAGAEALCFRPEGWVAVHL